MAADNKVTVEIGAQDKFSDVVNKFNDAMKDVGTKSKSSFETATSASQTFAIGLAAAGTAVLGVVALSIKAAADAEAQMAVVNATLATMGKKGEEAKAGILQAADASVKLGFDDEDAAVSITKLYQRTGDLTEATKLNQTAMDLARAKHIDLATASNMVGMVLSGNSKVLKQYGIDIKDSSSPMEALGELQKKVAGQADAFSKTFAGQMEVFHQQFQNLLETIGAPFLSVVTQGMVALSAFVERLGGVNGIVATVTSTFEFLEPYLPIIAGMVIGALVPAFIAWTVATVAWGVATVAAAAAGLIALAPYIIIGGAIAAVAVLLYTAWNSNFLGVRDIVLSVFNKIKEFWDTWGPVFIAVISAWWDLVKQVFKVAMDILTGNWSEAWTGIVHIAKTLGADLLVGWNYVWNAIGDSFKGIIDGIKNYFSDWWNTISGWIDGILTKLGLVATKASSTRGAAPAAKGHAFGGVVEGSYGLDNVPIMATAGEIVLNAMQQQNVASAIRTGGNGGPSVVISFEGASFYGDMPARMIQKIGDQLLQQLMPHLSFASR